MNIKENFYCSRCMRKTEDEGVCPFCAYDPAQPASRRVLEEGTLLQNGRYQLGAALGSGGFGITYAAWDYALEQAVAIKEYFPQAFADRDIWESNDIFTVEENKAVYMFGLQRFSREARILSTLQNLKNVVMVFDWFEANGTAYIVMEFVRGQTIDAYVRENGTGPQQLVEMFRELVSSLVSIHAQGVLHRDISPGNIMVGEDGSLKLIDFGASIVEQRRRQGMDQTIMFNRSFAPVEQYDEKGEQGAWTDIYALSATMYYLLTGELPQESLARLQRDNVKPLKTFRLGMKKWQEKAIMEGMAVQHGKRIQSMEHFRSVLYHLPMPEEVKRRRQFMLRAGIGAAVAAVIGILITINFTYGFYLGDGLRYGFRSDGFHVTGYSGSHLELTIPASRLGIPVSYIDKNVFQGKENLSFVIVPETVAEIGEFAFNNCPNLTNVILHEGVRNIQSQAFWGCSGLQAVEVPDSLENMEPDAFAGASKRLVLLGSLDGAAAKMAEGQGICFAQIETADNGTGVAVVQYETHQEDASIPDFIGGKPVTQIGSGVEKKAVFPEHIYHVILPDTLEQIGDYAFFGVPIEEINLPSALAGIGKYAFAQTQIEEIYIPDSVAYLGEAAFSVCLKLVKVRLSPNITYIPSGCFEQDTDLCEIDLPKGIQIREIQMLAFSGCEKLESVGMPDGCRIVGAHAFQNCLSLKLLYLPRSLTFMFRSALDGCPNSLVIAGDGGTYAESFAQNNHYEFSDMAYMDESMLISPSGSLMVDESAVESDVTVMPSYYMGIVYEEADVSGAGISETGAGAGESAPEADVGVGESAPAGMVTEESAPETGTVAEESAPGTGTVAEESASEAGMVAGESVPGTGVGAEESVPGTGMEAEESVLEAAKSALEVGMVEKKSAPGTGMAVEERASEPGMEAEESALEAGMVAGKSMLEAGTEAGESAPGTGMGAGKSMSGAGKSVPEVGMGIRESASEAGMGIGKSVPEAGVSGAVDRPEYGTGEAPLSYKCIIVKRVHNAQWLKSRRVILPQQAETLSTDSFCQNQYIESVECPDTLKVIGYSVFFGCKNLKSVNNLPEGLEEIEAVAFAGCTSLQEIDLPNSVRKIGYAAFENCSGITKIHIPASMVMLENDAFANTALSSVVIPGNIVKCEPAFYGCRQLEEAEVENGVRTLLGTFAECSNLRSVVLPESVEKISQSTFLNCQSLEDVWIYSMDAELNVYSPSVWHIEYQGIDEESGKALYEKVFLEREEESAFLFSDSPNVTLHCFAGSSAEEYAIKHGIKYERIPSAGQGGGKGETAAGQSGSVSESVLERIIPFAGYTSERYWGQMQYALGYGLTDIVYDCLDACAASGDASDGICVQSARLFIGQASEMEPGYTVGAVIGYFENAGGHPTLKAGDIIVKIDGEALQDAEDIFTLKEKNPSGAWEYTVLRPDGNSTLQEIAVTVSKEDPMAALRGITPKTFAGQNK